MGTFLNTACSSLLLDNGRSCSLGIHMIFFKIAAISFAILSPCVSHADSSSPSSHGPIGVMGDHLHNKGEWMFSYRNTRMNMDESQIGSNNISAREIVGTANNPGQFIVAPTKMTMDMHMLGAMYGLSNRITLVGRLAYVDRKMSHITRAGGEFVTRSSGIGDTKLGALMSLTNSQNHSIHAGLIASLPTGSIDERDDTPVMNDAFLPYPMQLGSGTFDLMPSIVYRGQSGQRSWSWGSKVEATIRTSTNDESYTLGDRLAATSWIARDISHHLSLSIKLNYQDWDQISGANPALNPLLIQTADPTLQGGRRLDASIGANYIFENGHRLAIEYAEPISQNLNGPQLQSESMLTVGWQKAF